MAMNKDHFHTHDNSAIIAEGIENLKQQLGASIGENKKLKQRIDELEGDNKDLRDDRKSSIELISDLHERIAELENENKELKDENAWHRCDIPNEDGLYNFPAEPGNYLVEFVSDYPESKESPFVTESEFDPDYNDWDSIPFGTHARQWREMVKAPEVPKCRPQESSEAK